MSRSLACSALVTLAVIAAAPARAQDPRGLAGAFDRLDADRDGVVTRGEFLASRQARFAALDRNHNGVIDAGDFPRLAGFIAGPAGSAPLFRQSDANGDGRISYDEFVAASVAMFDRADANHDGVLTRAEAGALAAQARAGRGGARP